MRRRSSCAVCPVKGAALCQALATEELLRLGRLGHRRHYRAGSVIANEDQPQDWLATVLTGVVKLIRTLADGRRQIVGLLFPSDLLGRPFSSRGLWDAEAGTGVELCCVGRSQFEALMHGSPALKQLLLERTLSEVDRAREWMLLLGRKTAAERVATLLLEFARRLRPTEGHAKETVEFDLPLSRTEMADYLGLRLETVSRNIWELEAAGLVQISEGRGIRLMDQKGLRRAAQCEP
jgi:CRP/FNR family transcriptional regulator